MNLKGSQGSEVVFFNQRIGYARSLAGKNGGP